MTKSEDSLIDLIQKKQSWGAHGRRVRDATIAGTAELQAESQRIVAGLQQSHEAELAQRQAAAQAASAALAQYSQTQQIIANMNQSSNAVMPLPQHIHCTHQQHDLFYLNSPTWTTDCY